ncbi:MAG: DUF4114 domain-containing protein [Desulforhopalus sp.]
MKKAILKSAFFATIGMCFLANNAVADVLPFGSGTGNANAANALQTVFDNITVDPVTKEDPTKIVDSTVNVSTDMLADDYDSNWSITGAANGAFATLIIELAGFANTNTFGLYDYNNTENKVELFGGSSGAGAQVSITIKDDGSVFVWNVDSEKDFKAGQFGFYLDSSAKDGGGLFYSNTDYNKDDKDHMYAYQGTGDMVKLPDLSAQNWLDSEYILAWEDLYNGGDRDYTDFVVMVSNVSPAPEPASMLLFGAGVAGLTGMVRRRKEKNAYKL